MSLSLADFQNRFKRLGHLIFLFQNAQSHSDALKKIHIAFIDQVSQTYAGAEDDSSEFDFADQCVNVLGAGVKAATDQITGLPGKARTAADTFLRRFVAPDIGQSSGTSYTTLGPALLNAMNAVGATLATTTGNPNGFAQWLSNQFAITLPTSDTPTIPDGWITDSVT